MHRRIHSAVGRKIAREMAMSLTEFKLNLAISKHDRWDRNETPTQTVEIRSQDLNKKYQTTQDKGWNFTSAQLWIRQYLYYSDCSVENPPAGPGKAAEPAQIHRKQGLNN